MKKKFLGFWFVLIAAALIILSVSAGEVEPAAYLPFIARAQNTPTPAPTSTAAPLPTSTPTPTATTAPLPTNTPTATNTPPPSAANLVITAIECCPAVTLNEWVDIKNNGGTAQNMTNWTLRDDAGNTHVYDFPDNFTLQPNATVRVWTQSGANNATNLYWGSGSPIWNNDGDCAYLRDGVGALVDEFCY